NAKVAKVEGPSRAELQEKTNWERVYEPKQIRIVAFKHKI
ncbi:coat protein, partial [Clostridium botulinum]|nr:coat protein [Clostridium botulinum]